MKARDKETGDIIEIDENCSYSYVYAKNYDKSYALANLEFLDVKENENPDYWEKLKHQAAISAMQGIMANTLFMPYDGKEIADLSNDIATALVEKLKEK